MYVESVKFLKDHRTFKKGETFELQNLTLLVGDQGSGKSSLLDLLKGGCDRNTLDLELTELGHKGVETFFFDTEKMNPRLKSPQDYANMDGTNKGIGYGNALSSQFQSHGQVMVAFTVNAIKKAENAVVFLDEPESGLSIRNQYKLSSEIHNAVNQRKCQFIVATHCLPLIQSIKNVLSLEPKKWMTTDEFLESQKL